MSLAEMMSRRRDKLDLSVREVARQVGCNPMVISRVESGEAPSTHNLALIVAWLELKPKQVAEVVARFG